VEIKRLSIHGRPDSKGWIHVQLLQSPIESKGVETVTADILMVDEEGESFVEIEGLTEKKIDREALLSSIRPWKDWLYETVWLNQPLEGRTEAQAETSPGRWLILADETGLGRNLAELLRHEGDECLLVFRGGEYKKTDTQTLHINPSSRADFIRMAAELSSRGQPPVKGAVNLWSLDVNATEPLSPKTVPLATHTGLRSTLYLLQSLTECSFENAPPLWLCTRGSQEADSAPALKGLVQSPLWGMAKVIALEHPEFTCRRIDLSQRPQADETRKLMNELTSGSTEDQVAFGLTGRYVSRLVSSAQITSVDRRNRLLVPANLTYRMDVSSRGTLDNLSILPLRRRQPGKGQVEIRVRATGLNFKDVLNALGMYPGDPGPLGGEIAGEVVGIGKGVTDLSPGDAVIAIAPGGFSQYVTVDMDMVAPKPRNLSFAEAATIPIVFLTSYYCLNHIAGMKKGDKVLIHAAAGGVGLASIQLAQQAKAEVFATASKGKWEFLRSLGLKNIMNSRTPDFDENIMAITGGKGLDIVLNSLSGEFIPKSLSVLGKEGRFVEIGKRDVWSPERVAAFRLDAVYRLVDLMDVCKDEPGLIRSMLRELVTQFEVGTLKPLPMQSFPIENSKTAFRTMQQGRHIGKIVIVHPAPMAKVREDATYLVTGGTGGLGSIVARRLAGLGAKHLVLLGRNTERETFIETIKELGEEGVDVTVAKVDVSDPVQLDKVIRQIESSPFPLRGVVHAAGSTDDEMLRKLSWEQFDKVIESKLTGAWNLHTLTRSASLDFFVSFSSVVSLLGNFGQANYAAANAFLDSLAHFQRGHGLAGTSINWGPWAEVGMAADEKLDNQFRLGGIMRIPPEAGGDAFASIISMTKPQVGVFSVENIDKFTARYPTMLSESGRPTVALEKPSMVLDLIKKLKAASDGDRLEHLSGYLEAQTCNVLGFSSTVELEPALTLQELGFDSLMLVEMRNRIISDLGISISMEDLVGNTTLEALAAMVLSQMDLSKVVLHEAPPEQDGEGQDTEKFVI
jgi:NADPH:quinone reductase-like Zn-dependent oxidoreductase/acyl carrier protein